jgi:hypothetical protein
MKEIQLPCGRTTIVDDDVYEWAVAFKWHSLIANNKVYVRRNLSRVGGGRRQDVCMHRQIMNAQPGQEVDHKNHDGLDNRRENLRLCTRSQNKGNRRSFKNRTGFKGVYRTTVLSRKQKRQRRREKILAAWCGTPITVVPPNHYSARIICQGVARDLGVYKDARDAAEAYDRAALSLFGEFALTNFPVEFYL